MTRAVLMGGNPQNAGTTGAVLRYRKEASAGTIVPDRSTPLKSAI